MADSLQFGDFRIDLDREIVIRPDGAEVRPRPQAFMVLRHLAMNAGRIVGKDELVDAVWPGIAVTDDSLVQCVADIRRALGAPGHKIVRTLPKRGYLLEAVVQVAPTGRAASPVETSDLLRPSMAVLPFRTLGGEALAESLCEGIAEDLTVELSRASDLVVVARQSSCRFDPASIDPEEVGRTLGVRFLLMGSVRVFGERVRVAAHLVACAGGKEIWAERYDRALTLNEVFDIQIEIARTVTATVMGRIASADAPPPGRRPEGVAAYQLVLQGIRSMHHYTREDLEAAREAFRAAIAAEPGYGRPYGLLAMTEIYLPWYWGLDTDVSAAVVPAQRAVALDERDAKGHCALGITRMMARDHAGAREHFETGLRMNPNDDLLLIEYARFMMYDDRPEEGLKLVAEAMRLNPFHPNWYWNIEGRCLHTLGRFGEAITAFERVANPPFWTLAYLASCAAALGDAERAGAMRAQLLASRPDFTLERFSTIFPYRNEATLARFLDTLRAAGVP
jgi:TolB-like protein/Tfp pilus assembly protein PilF